MPIQQNKSFIRLIENYIYLYQFDEYLIIPIYPESITDSNSVNFQETQALSRSAPVFSYSNSGPRSIQVSLKLHRSMLNDIENVKSNMKVKDLYNEDDTYNADYIDLLINRLQTMTMPKYDVGVKAVEPPLIAVRFGNEIFIRGVVNGSISITYSGPILDNNKYAVVDISFNVSEIDPYDASIVYKDGSFRGLTKTFKDGIYVGG